MILVTRPDRSAIKTANKLNSLGYKTLILPLLKIYHSYCCVKDHDYAAVIISSQNALHSINKNKWIKSKKIYVVGKSTETLLKNYGCKDVLFSDKGAKELSEIIIDNTKPYSKLLYLRGKQIAYDLEQCIKQNNLYIDSSIVYKSIARRYIRQKLLKMIRSTVDIILFYSPRSAQIFSQLSKKYALNLSNKRVVCISEAVASKVQDLNWKKTSIAKMPNQDSILSAL